MSPIELHNIGMTEERIIPYPLRIPPEMRGKLEAAAKAGDRSLHAEIMRRLEESLKERPRKLPLYEQAILNEQIKYQVMQAQILTLKHSDRIEEIMGKNANMEEDQLAKLVLDELEAIRNEEKPE